MKITDKYVPNLILSILLVFSLIGSAAMVVAKYYLLNEKTFIENSDENNIPDLAMEEIEKYFKDSEDYSGIPADVYISTISKDDIRYIINLKISKAFAIIADSEQMQPFDYKELENRITNYFDNFAEKNNVEVDEAYNTQLQKTIDTAKSEIEDFSDIYMLDFMYEKNVLSKLSDLYKYIDTIMYICLGLALVCVIIMIIISRKKISNAFYWYSMSFICSSALMLIPTLYVKFSDLISKLIIRNECIYAAMTSYMEKIISVMLMLEIAMLFIGIILIVFNLLVSKKDKN